MLTSTEAASDMEAASFPRPRGSEGFGRDWAGREWRRASAVFAHHPAGL